MYRYSIKRLNTGYSSPRKRTLSWFCTILAICGVFGGFLVSAEETAQLTKEKMTLIQRYFDVTLESKAIGEEKSTALEVLEKESPHEEEQILQEKRRKVWETFTKQKAGLFDKHNITREEYEQIQGEIVNRPGILKSYIEAGGSIHGMDEKQKSKPLPTRQERLKKAGIILDLLDGATINKALNNPRVRLDIINVLGEKQDPMAIPYLLEQLNNKELLVSLASAGALCQHKRFDGVPLLLKALTDTSQHLMFRISAIDSAGLCQEKAEIVDALVKLLETDPNGTLRMHAAIHIDQRGDPALMDKLIKLRTIEKDVMVHHLLDKTIRRWEREKRIQELGGTVIYKKE